MSRLCGADWNDLRADVERQKLAGCCPTRSAQTDPELSVDLGDQN